MAEHRRAQLELWRQERLREKRPVETTTVAVQRRVVRPTANNGRGHNSTSAGATRNVSTSSSTTSSSTTTGPRVRTTPLATASTSALANSVEPRRVSGDSDSRQTSLDSASGGEHDVETLSTEKKPRKEKRRTSFILPSPSNSTPSLSGGAKRVLTPTRLTPPKASDTDTIVANDDDAADDSDDESDGGFGPSPRKKRRVAAQPRQVYAMPMPMPMPDLQGDKEQDETLARVLFDDHDTDADARSVRTTLSFGAVSRPLRVLHTNKDDADHNDDDDDDASEFGVGHVDTTETKHAITADSTSESVPVPPRSDPLASLFTSFTSSRVHSETNEPPLLTGSRSGPPLRVRTSDGGGSMGPPVRRTSTSTGGDGAKRKSLDETKPILTLEERVNERRNWDMDDFVVTKNLGKGKFGNVYLAKEKHSNVSVALKVLYKSPLILEGGLKNLQREVEIQQRLLHPNVLRLFGYFYDDSCVYLILEFASHGELYKLLSKQRYFSDAFAAHYIAQVVDALEYLHGCHVIHRDIKPENLLLGPNHTIKLADFGWSVHAPQQFATRRTFCGTPDYLSPELVLGEEYDHRVDVWSVGVLAYEFLFGVAPFHVDNQMDMYKRIETVDFQFPSEPPVSERAKRFISRLLQRNPNDRMTLAEAKTHEWLAQRPSI